ncbi:MAG: hypothetical protein GY765_41615 [bacterium]|nr:hypothetical protein [bacterium]
MDFLQLYPMNFEEFLLALNERKAGIISGFSQKTSIPEAIHREMWKDLKTYYVTGGMPEVVKRYLDLKANTHEAFTSVRTAQQSILEG